jgi:hypothetical protein
MVLSFVLYFSYGTFPTAVLGRRVVSTTHSSSSSTTRSVQNHLPTYPNLLLPQLILRPPLSPRHHECS